MIIAQPETIFLYLPLYIAKEKLNFELINCGNDNSVIEAVKESRADVAVGDPMMFNEVEYEKVKLIAGFINKSLLQIITFNQFLEDIKGKTLVTYPRPSTSFILSERLAKKYNLRLIETEFNTELGPILTGEADMTLILEPNFSQAVRNRAKTILSLTNEPYAFTGFSSKKNHPELLKAINCGIKKFYEDDELALKIAKKYFSLPKEDLISAINNIRKLNPYNLKFTKQEVNNALKARKLDYEKVKDKIKSILKK